MTTSVRIASLVLLVAVAGCESDADKTERLRDAAQNDCLTVLAHENSPNAPAPTDVERSKCETSRHAYNAFLDGR